MMRNGEDDDAIGFHAVEEREAEAFDDDAARVAGGRRAGAWKGKGAGGRILDRCREALAQAGLRLIVVDDFGEEL
ncbi:MAG: hypothetical protein WCA09_09905 [Burkholderiales bacterium]